MKSFWGNFGWLDTPLVIISNSISRLLLRLLKYINIVVLGLVLLRLGSIARRLFNAARAGRWRQALSVGASNPLMNSFFLFTVIMFMINAYSGGYTNQGRYWFPFLLPILLLGTWYAPAALPYRRIRATFAYGITTALVLYCIFGSYYAVESVIARYYR